MEWISVSEALLRSTLESKKEKKGAEASAYVGLQPAWMGINFSEPQV